MSKYFIFITFISLPFLSSCLIERPADWLFLEPLDYQDTTYYHKEKINSSVFIDEKNNIKLTLISLVSNTDTLECYELIFIIENYSQNKLAFKVPLIKLFDNTFEFRSDKVEDVFILSFDSVTTEVRFYSKEKNQSFKSKLSEREASIVVTDISLEKLNKKIIIPELYFEQ